MGFGRVEGVGGRRVAWSVVWRPLRDRACLPPLGMAYRLLAAPHLLCPATTTATTTITSTHYPTQPPLLTPPSALSHAQLLAHATAANLCPSPLPSSLSHTCRARLPRVVPPRPADAAAATWPTAPPPTTCLRCCTCPCPTPGRFTATLTQTSTTASACSTQSARRPCRWGREGEGGCDHIMRARGSCNLRLTALLVARGRRHHR